jgi:hypothetical protein
MSATFVPGARPFLLPNELAPVGLCNTFPHGSTKSGIFLKQTQSSVLH